MFSNDRTFKISGGGGVGKTFLMLYIMKEVFTQYEQTCQLMNQKQQYDSIELTATTNKAAEVLAKVTGYPTSTIHSFLGLKVYDDYRTGESKITRGRNWRPIHNRIVFIDECSFIDRALEREILATLVNCKIVYVGDHCQLAPIKEPISPIYNKQDPMVVLTQPMRNADQPALQHLCNQVRNTVETGIFPDIQEIPGTIDFVNDAELKDILDRDFLNINHNNKILAYTNNKVIAFNDYIRGIRALPKEYTVNELLITSQACHTASGLIPVEREVEITHLGPISQMMIDGKDGQSVSMDVRECALKAVLGNDEEGTMYGTVYQVLLPVDRDHYHSLVKYYGRTKDWMPYYDLKNNYPDLRPRDASTVHKAQGSTYDHIVVDLSDMSTCRQSDVMARMLYVALTRARKRIFIYGNLPEKYGKLIPASPAARANVPGVREAERS